MPNLGREILMPLVNVPESKLSERDVVLTSREKLEAETLEVYTIGLLQARAFATPSWDVRESRVWDGSFGVCKGKSEKYRDVIISLEQSELQAVFS